MSGDEKRKGKRRSLISPCAGIIGRPCNPTDWLTDWLQRNFGKLQAHAGRERERERAALAYYHYYFYIVFLTALSSILRKKSWKKREKSAVKIALNSKWLWSNSNGFSLYFCLRVQSFSHFSTLVKATIYLANKTDAHSLKRERG